MTSARNFNIKLEMKTSPLCNIFFFPSAFWAALGCSAALLPVAFVKETTAPSCLEVSIIHQMDHYAPCWTVSSVQRFLPEALKHSISLCECFQTFSIDHTQFAHHPPLAFTFYHFILFVLFFCHLPPNLLNPPRSPILMRRKTETTRIEGRRRQPFLSRGCG